MKCFALNHYMEFCAGAVSFIASNKFRVSNCTNRTLAILVYAYFEDIPEVNMDMLERANCELSGRRWEQFSAIAGALGKLYKMGHLIREVPVRPNQRTKKVYRLTDKGAELAISEVFNLV